MPGTFSPPPRVSDPDMHHGMCMTHMPRCMPGSLTCGFLWSRWRGKRSQHCRRMRNPQFYVSGKRSMQMMRSLVGSRPVIKSWSFDTLQWRPKSPASRLFTQSFIQAQINEHIKVPRHWPLCEEFIGDRWIPRTNGQLRGKCFHLMTSSWSIITRSLFWLYSRKFWNTLTVYGHTVLNHIPN